jgi:hypothetical protein
MSLQGQATPETLLPKPRPRRILCRLKGRKRDLKSWRTLRTSLSLPLPSRILRWTEAENEYAVPGDPLKHSFFNLTQFQFSAPKRQKVISQG